MKLNKKTKFYIIAFTLVLFPKNGYLQEKGFNLGISYSPSITSIGRLSDQNFGNEEVSSIHKPSFNNSVDLIFNKNILDQKMFFEATVGYIEKSHSFILYYVKNDSTFLSNYHESRYLDLSLSANYFITKCVYIGLGSEIGFFINRKLVTLNNISIVNEPYQDVFSPSKKISPGLFLRLGYKKSFNNNFSIRGEFFSSVSRGPRYYNLGVAIIVEYNLKND